MQQKKIHQMKNDLSFINSEVDLDQAIQLVQKRITDTGIQIKEQVKQVPGVLLKKAVENSKFFLVGSVSAGLISMVIKKLAFSRKPQPVTKSLPQSLASFALK